MRGRPAWANTLLFDITAIFAAEIADRVIFTDQGVILKEEPPATFFQYPKHERSAQFFAKIISRNLQA